MLGGGLRRGAITSQQDLAWLLVWMVVACFSILVHEFGHALTARRLSGGRNSIRLWAMGGLAYHEGGKPTRKTRLWTIFMGPGAGFLLFALTCVAIISIYGVSIGKGIIQAILFRQHILHPDVYDIYHYQDSAWRLFSMLIQLNFWWSLVNLLPVYPLDGGQFFSTWTGKTRATYQLGAAVGALTSLVVILFFFERWYVAILFGYLAYKNFKSLQNFQGKGSWS